MVLGICAVEGMSISWSAQLVLKRGRAYVRLGYSRASNRPIDRQTDRQIYLANELIPRELAPNGVEDHLLVGLVRLSHAANTITPTSRHHTWHIINLFVFFMTLNCYLLVKSRWS